MSGALALAALPSVAGPARAAMITIGPTALTRARPHNFLSLSVTFRMIERSVGPAGQPVDPVLVQLVRNLDPHGVPVLRVGGQGADRAWWPVKHMGRPPGVSNTLSPRFTSAARRLAQALPARYLLQVNLEADSTRLTHVEADHLISGIGRAHIAALEIGNEPDLYSTEPWYWTVGGRALPWYADRGTPVFARPVDYGPGDFVAEVRRFARVLPRGIPLAGPDLVDPSWMGAFAALMTRHSRVRMLDAHVYPLIKCVTDPASPHYPSIAHLLALSASRDLLAGNGPYIAQARREGGRFVVDEVGAVSCGGTPGVSNSMASALWVMDALFALDRAGIDGVDLHDLSPTVGSLFDLSRAGGRWRARIHPIYLGALLFAQAAPAGSRLLGVSGVDQSRLRVWATRGRDGDVRALLINPGGHTTVELRPPAGYRAQVARVERLRARSVAATGGLRIAGRSFSRTSTGLLPTPHPQRVKPHGGRYAVAVPGSSAALVTFTRRS